MAGIQERADTAAALIPALHEAPDREALRVGEQALSYRELRDAVAALAGELDGAGRVAVFAEASLETAVAFLAALAAAVPAVALNPKLGSRELEHIVGDSEPGVVLAREGATLPAELGGLRRVQPDLAPADAPELPPEAGAEAPALVLYTSGTTGPPKGVVIPRRAISSNLDGLAEAWEWTGDDALVHGLPLFHVHGLILGLLGPLRRGGRLHHVVRFSPEAVGAALAAGGTMLFGVPTMYHRLAEAAEQDGELAQVLGRARVLVSGSAPLPVRDHERIEQATGQQVVERYGLTETIMNTAVHTSGERRPGYVGPPVPGVELRLVDDAGAAIEASDDETIGEVVVRGPNVFAGYLNRPDATAEVLRDGWFFTGDMATRAADGYIRIVGRRATDIIKTGGYKVGAGEIEAALMEHAAVAEVAVTGEPDEDLGERIVAWVVPRGEERPSERELADHVAGLLTPHKRPRAVRFIEALPRNELGKVQKKRLEVPE